MGDAHIVVIYVREGEFPEPYTAGEPLVDDYLSKALALSGLLLLRKRNQLGPIVLGILTLRKSHSTGGMVFGVYLLLIGVSYVPMLIQAISLVKNGTARDEIADELEDKRDCSGSIENNLFNLLVPLVVPIAGWMRRPAKLP